jgi:hypothetical protein
MLMHVVHRVTTVLVKVKTTKVYKKNLCDAHVQGKHITQPATQAVSTLGAERVQSAK